MHGWARLAQKHHKRILNGNCAKKFKKICAHSRANPYMWEVHRDRPLNGPRVISMAKALSSDCFDRKFKNKRLKQFESPSKNVEVIKVSYRSRFNALTLEITIGRLFLGIDPCDCYFLVGFAIPIGSLSTYKVPLIPYLNRAGDCILHVTLLCDVCAVIASPFQNIFQMLKRL